MDIIKGKYTSADIFCENLEKSDVGLIQAFCDSEAAKSSEMKIMPDAHYGKGCSIGSVIKFSDRVSPGLLGPDGGCGVLGVKLKIKRLNLEQIDKIIKEKVPAGQHCHGKPLESATAKSIINSLHCQQFNKDKVKACIGSLGGGNHFISIENDDEGYNWLFIHSGSRSLGACVEKYWHDIAYEKTKNIVPYELAFLEGEEKNKYIEDTYNLQLFAKENREIIAKLILSEIKAVEYEVIDIPHNYIDGNILRKGAIASPENEKILIPLNMRDGTLICKGKGNLDWFCSAPHGAGRLYARSEMKNKFSTSEYKEQMRGIYSSTISPKTLDEAPMAYKNSEYIKNAIEPTAEILTQTKPIYNFKAVDS